MKRILGIGIGVVILIIAALLFWWSRTPKAYDISQLEMSEKPVVGEYTTRVTIHQLDWLLGKPGGFSVNDVSPPGVLMDNMPEFEYGVITLVRDWALSMRDDMSRSQTQSQEDSDMVDAQILLNNDIDRWIFPSPESRIKEARTHFDQYLGRLMDMNVQNAQFYARADNLVDWLDRVNKRLGAMSDQLAASTGEKRTNIDLAGDASAEQSTTTSQEVRVQTKWHKVDDSFFYVRGYTWALLMNLEAIRSDFKRVLEDKNALASVDQIIRELREAQTPLTTPMIFWGTSGYGMFNNQSKSLSSDISRANAALIDLVKLLRQG